MKSKYFYIRQDGKILGPIQASSLEEMIRSGTLSAEIQASVDKLSWSPLKDLLYVVRNTVPSRPIQPAVLQPEFLPEMEHIPVNAEESVHIPDHEIGEEPESDVSPCESREEKHDPVNVAGRTLHLIWNAPEKLPALARVQLSCLAKVFLPVSFGFSLLITQAAAVSAAIFFGGYLRKMLFMAVWFFGCSLLVFIEAEILHLVSRKRALKKGSVPDSGIEPTRKTPLLLTGMLWINMGVPACVWTLYYALNVLPGPGAMPLWVLVISWTFLFGVGSFFVANTVMGVNTGVKMFYGMRPHHGIWLAALFLWQFMLLCEVAKLCVAKWL